MSGKAIMIDYKKKAKSSLENSEQFAVMVMEEVTKEVKCIVNANRVNSSSFLYTLLHEVCDKWGEVTVSEVLVHFLSSKEGLYEVFKAHLQED